MFRNHIIENFRMKPLIDFILLVTVLIVRSEKVNLITCGDLSCYPVEELTFVGGLPYSYLYKMFENNLSVWYGNDTTVVQIRDLTGFDGVFMDTIKTSPPKTFCHDVSISEAGLYTLKFSFILDCFNFYSAEIWVHWDDTQLETVQCCNCFIDTHTLRIQTEAGTKTLCFTGANPDPMPPNTYLYDGAMIRNASLYAPVRKNITFSIQKVKYNSSTLLLTSDYPLQYAENIILFDELTNIKIDNVSLENKEVVNSTDGYLCFEVISNPYTENSVMTIELPEYVLLDEDNLPIRFETTVGDLPLTEKSSLEYMEDLLKIVGFYSKASMAALSMVTVAYFLFRFLSFIQLISLYYYLKLTSPTNLYYYFYDHFISSLMNEGSFSFIINLFRDQKMSFEFVKQIPERIPSTPIYRDWFLENSFSSILLNNLIEDVMFLGLTLLKIFFFHIFTKMCGCQIKDKRRYLLIILLEVLLWAPNMIPPIMIQMTSQETVISQISFAEKVNNIANFSLLGLIILLPILIFFLKDSMIKKIKKKECIQWKKKITLQKKYRQQKSVNKIKLLDNIFYISIPFFIGIGNKWMFFLVTTPIIFFRLCLLLSYRKYLSKSRFVVNLVDKIIWIGFQITNLFFYLHELNWFNNVGKQQIVISCYISLFFIVFGILLELVVWLVSAFIFIIRWIKKKCNKLNQVTPEAEIQKVRLKKQMTQASPDKNGEPKSMKKNIFNSLSEEKDNNPANTKRQHKKEFKQTLAIEAINDKQIKKQFKSAEDYFKYVEEKQNKEKKREKKSKQKKQQNLKSAQKRKYMKIFFWKPEEEE